MILIWTRLPFTINAIKLWRGNLNHVSLYEDVIVEGGVHYIIVKMLTKK